MNGLVSPSVSGDLRGFFIFVQGPCAATVPLAIAGRPSERPMRQGWRERLRGVREGAGSLQVASD